MRKNPTMKASKIYIILISLSVCVTVSMSYKYSSQECKCMCSGYNNQNVCEHLRDLRLEIDANTEELKKWVHFFPFVQHLKNKWREEIVSIFENEIKKYVGSGNFLPKPEYLMMDKEDDMMNDVNVISRHSDSGEELAKNVSNLIAKVEMVENRTMEVEEELKNERRVRRHLEQDLKDTQSSLLTLGDQLQNVTVPVDAMMSHVQMVLFLSLEDMNKTIYEDHIQNLYYKVDGVVYQNETRMLGERLDHVETELHDVNNDRLVSKLVEDVNLLEDNLIDLNRSIENYLTPRLFSLGTEVINRDTVEGLEQRILNNTELFHTVWSEILDFKSFQQNMQNFSEDFRTSLETLQLQIEGLKKEMAVGGTDSNYDVQLDDIDESVDVLDVRKADTLNDSRIDVIQVRKIEDLDDAVDAVHLDDIGDVEDTDDLIQVQKVGVSNDTIDVVDVRKVKTFSDDVNDMQIREVDDMNDTDNDILFRKVSSLLPGTELVNDEKSSGIQEYDVTPNTTETAQVDENFISGYDILTCTAPNILDPELLVDFEEDEDNGKTLIFGCRSIGLYAVINGPIPMRCEEGSWRGSFPSCRMLASEKEIEHLSEILKEDNPCRVDIGEFPDPTNCSRFFKCVHQTGTVMSCPPGLHFNPELQVCDYPKAAGCTPVKNEMFQTLHDLIPPIIIEPNNLDKPNGLMGTGSAGQLIVHPRSSFTLHCMFPEFLWGYPVWNVTYFRPSAILRPVPRDGTNRISLNIIAANEEDSGIYRCLTPFGQENFIRVVVKAVLCPPIELGDEYEEVYYRPIPEGEQRILGTTAEFQCEEGGKASVICLASGNWSRQLPDPEECTPKRKRSDDDWKCSPLDTSTEPNLILEKNYVDKTVAFKCAGRLQLIGNSFTRCRDDGLWSHKVLPQCIS